MVPTLPVVVQLACPVVEEVGPLFTVSALPLHDVLDWPGIAGVVQGTCTSWISTATILMSIRGRSFALHRSPLIANSKSVSFIVALGLHREWDEPGRILRFFLL